MKLFNLIFTSLGLPGGPLGAAETGPTKPNIIYLLSDDMGYSIAAQQR